MFPQHVRFDRDNYIDIWWNDIEPGWYRRFDILPESIFPSFGIAYNYASLMQFGELYGSKNGRFTMTAVGNEHGVQWTK